MGWGKAGTPKVRHNLSAGPSANSITTAVNSEREPQVQTDGAWRRPGQKTRDPPGGGSPDKSIGVVVRGGVGEVVKQDAQLEHLFLVNFEVLEETLVPDEHTGTVQDIDSAIPERVCG